MLKREKIYNSLYLGIIGLLIIATYYSTLWWLIFVDLTREDYNYGYIIPFIVCYLLWEKKDILKSVPSIPSWKGIILIISGIIIFWLGELAGEFYSQYISLWIIIVGLVWCFVGWSKLKKIIFPLMIIPLMFPLPQFINNRLTLKLKLISSKLSVLFLQFLDIPAYREGNIIDLGFTRLQVADACSGLRYLFPLLVLGIIMVYFYKEKLWKKLIIVLSTIPLSIITNALRIAITGILYKKVGQEVAEGFFHAFSGWLIFILNMLIILGEMWLLKKIFPYTSFNTKTPDKAKNKNEHKDEKLNAPLKPSYLTFIAIFIIFFLNTCMVYSIKLTQKKIPINKALSTFPVAVDGWKGTHDYLTKDIINALDLSDYVILNYQNSEGKTVNFYVAYYEIQTKGKSIHSPRSCFTGSGWVLKQDGLKKVRLSNNKTIVVRRLYMEKTGNRQICYYWFYLRGRVISDAYHVKFFNFLDSITRHRTDGALIRIVTPIYNFEMVRDADKRLENFIRMIYPILNKYLPA